jgi:hypothetical protein
LRRKQAEFRDPQKALDNFDFTFNPRIDRSLVFGLAAGAFLICCEDILFLGPPGAGKMPLSLSHWPSRHPAVASAHWIRIGAEGLDLLQNRWRRLSSYLSRHH